MNKRKKAFMKEKKRCERLIFERYEVGLKDNKNDEKN